MNARSILTSCIHLLKSLYSHGSPFKLSSIRYSNLPSRTIFPLVSGLLSEIPGVSESEMQLTVRLATDIYGSEMTFFLRDNWHFIFRFWAWFYSFCPDFIRQFSNEVTRTERRILRALAKTANVGLDDIICFNLKNRDVFQPCWAMIHQPQEQRIVIVARGTLSILDGYTDIDFGSEPLSKYIDDLDPAMDFYVHRGVLQATLWMYDSIALTLHHWINQQMVTASNGYMNSSSSSVLASGSFMQMQRSYSLAGRAPVKHPFRLLLSGHSLGSATTVLLGVLLLLRHPNYWNTSNMKCIGYGCPPFSNAAFSDWTRPWLTLFVYDMDLVPRLGAHSLEVRMCRAVQYAGDIVNLESVNSISRRLMRNNSLILAGRVYLIQPTSRYMKYGYSQAIAGSIHEASSPIGEPSFSVPSQVFSRIALKSRGSNSMQVARVPSFDQRYYFVTAVDPHDFAETLLNEAALYDHFCYCDSIPYIFATKDESI